jgi:predicted PurR-regulated permease PerM
MRNIFLTFLLVLFIPISHFAQDSLQNVSIERIKAKIKAIDNQLDQTKSTFELKLNQNDRKVDSITKLSNSYFEETMQLVRDLANKEFIKLHSIENSLNRKYDEQMKFNQWQAIIYAIMIVLIALLFILISRIRKNSITYLISESNKLASSQEDIREKSNKLYELSLEMAEYIKSNNKAIKTQNKSLKEHTKTIKTQGKRVEYSHQSILEKLKSTKGKKKKK